MPKPLPRKKNHPASPHPWRLYAWLFFALALMGSVLFGGMWAWAWVQKPTSFPIKQIHIQGQLIHETPAKLQGIIQAHLNGGFFSLDISPIKQAILALPWVNTVSFRRVWPSALLIRIEEQTAVARFGKSGVLNAQGILFHPDVKSIPDNLPEFDGSIDQAQSLLTFYQSANLLAKLLNVSITELKINSVRSWRLTLSNQVEVILGHEDAMLRFKRFVAIYPQIVKASTQPILSVDLRYPNGVAVAYQEKQTSAKK